MTRLPPLRLLLHLLFFLSGGAGLGYQIVWAKMFAAGLGHELPAVLAVVAAFMGGMACGAWLLDRTVSRSAVPGRWYAGLEIVIGLWGFLSTVLVPAINQGAAVLIGLEPSPLRHWAVAFSLPLLVLLPATAAMGATLPAMERFVAPLAKEGRCVGGLYAANTLGAVTGALAGAFALAPALGFRRTVWLLASVNVLCGLAAWCVGGQTAPAGTSEVGTCGDRNRRGNEAEGSVSRGAVRLLTSAATILDPALPKGRVFATVFLTGLLGIGYETVGVRVLAQVLENTVYTFAAVLAIYLLGTALGAALYQRFGRDAKPRLLLTDLLLGLSFACLLGVWALRFGQALFDGCRSWLGDSPAAVLAAEMAVAATVFGLPTLFMGAVFSHLVQAARQKDRGVGQATALNTLGGALAPALFNVALLPTLGSKWSLVVIGLGYLALLPGLTGWRWVLLPAPLLALFALPPNFHFVPVPPNGRLAEYREGIMASVAVVEDAAGHRTLRVDNRFQMGGTAAAAAEYRHAHIPLLLHPAPKRALFLGLGTGITLGAAGLYPGLESDGVELVPEVVEVMPQFEPHNFSPRRHPRLKVRVADARRFVRATQARYDVIVADLFHPARDGAGSLYTLEHFRAVRDRLEAGGVFCQWLPLYQLDEAMLRVITRTFLKVFPRAGAWLLWFNVDTPVLGLIGWLEEPRYSAQWVERRLDGEELEAHLKRLALAASVRLFGHLLAGPDTLRSFAAEAPLNTDDQPRVTFGAPRFAYQRGATSYGRLLALLDLGLPDARETLRLGSGVEAASLARRLTGFMRARNVYLHGLVEQAEGRLAQAIELYLESARLSEDFTSGYAQCLTLASLQAQAQPNEARALLQRLVEAQPANPVAREFLERLSGKP
jgi:spermidine synthase